MFLYEEITIRKAVLEDVEKIFLLMQKTIKWLNDNNIDQWNVTRTYGKEYYIKKVFEGKYYVATVNNEICGSFLLNECNTYYETSEDAIYIHHLVADSKYKGVGSHMLNKIKEIALELSKKSVRLDNISTNEKLNQYYEKNGFKKIGIIEASIYDGKNVGILREFKLD